MTDASNKKKKRSIQIDIPDYLKHIDETIWEELETYLFQGFLTSPSYIFEKTFVFKTLNQHELKYIEFLRPLKRSPPEIQALYRAAFIAHSIFIVDGKNVIHKRADYIDKLIDIIRKVPPDHQDKIVENLGALNQKASRLYPLVEVYVYENRSRFKWHYISPNPIHSPICTGIPGTDELGMNYCQQSWVTLNALLDKRDKIEAEWANAKFIGSCFAGKGIRAIDEKDKSRKNKERVDREDLKMKVLYEYLNRRAKKEEDKIQEMVALPDGRRATVERRLRAESVEELADQLSASLSGEKDHHDLVVEAHQRQVQERYRDIERSKIQMYSVPAVYHEGSTSEPLHGPSRVLGGKAEANALVKRLREIQYKNTQNIEKREKIEEIRQSSDKPDLSGQE
jgi:hypothetical protein